MKKTLTVLLLLFANTTVLASEGVEKSKNTKVENATSEAFFSALPLYPEKKDKKPDLTIIQSLLRDYHGEITRLTTTPIKGLYQVMIGSTTYYVSDDGRFLLKGDMIDLSTLTNLSREQQQLFRKQEIQAIAKDDMIIYPPKGEVKHVVTVFTDVDCQLCHFMHENIFYYNGLGIEVRYVLFPVRGLQSSSYQRLQAVWCADDKKLALDRLNSGSEVKSEECESPLKRSYDTGLRLGINSVPTIILEDGTTVSGFIAPDNLLGILQQEDQGENGQILELSHK